jgi:outer membrane protein TolC
MKRIRSVLIINLLVVSSLPAQQSQVLSVSDVLAELRAKNHLIKAAEYEVQRASLAIKQIKQLRDIPQMDLKMYTGLVPQARGDIFSSPDKSDDLDGFGPFYRASFQLTKSLYTFGRTSSALAASYGGVSLEQARTDQILQNLSYDALAAYWGVSSASKAEAVAREMRTNYDRFLAEVRERLQDDSSDVDDADRFEVEAYAYSITEAEQESERLRILASRSLNALLDKDIRGLVETANEAAPDFLFDESQLEMFIAHAVGNRPDLRAIFAALDTLKAKEELARSQRMPIFYLAAGLSYGIASNRADQTNPFIWDSFNYRRLTAAFGLSWDLNIFQQNLKIQRAQYEHEAVQEKLLALKSWAQVEVSEAFAEARKNNALLLSARSARKSARSWVRLTAENWSMGLGEVWRMLRAYEAYYRLRRVEIEREYQHHLSLAALALSMGDLDMYLKWVEDGKVQLD